MFTVHNPNDACHSISTLTTFKKTEDKPATIMGFFNSLARNKSTTARTTPSTPSQTPTPPSFTPTRLLQITIDKSSHKVDSRISDLGQHAVDGSSSESSTTGSSRSSPHAKRAAWASTSTLAAPSHRAAAPWLEIRKTKWYGKTFFVFRGAEELARWSPGWSSSATNEVRFAAARPASPTRGAAPPTTATGTLRVETDGRCRWYFRERFVLGQGEEIFHWLGEDWWGGNEVLRLVRGMRVGEGPEEVVGSFIAAAGGDGGGVLAVDGRAVDVLVAALSCVVVLRKGRQRQSEGRNG